MLDITDFKAKFLPSKEKHQLTRKLFVLFVKSVEINDINTEMKTSRLKHFRKQNDYRIGPDTIIIIKSGLEL